MTRRVLACVVCVLVVALWPGTVVAQQEPSQPQAVSAAELKAAIDSLGNLELRTHIEAETGIRITSSDITTVRGLADHLYAKLAPKEEDVATPA